MAQRYTSILVHVPSKAHHNLLKAVTQSRGLSVKLDLTKTPDHKLFVTAMQRKKIEEAISKGRKEMSLRFTAKQARYNKETEGGFLSAMLGAASRFLPGIIAGLLAGSASPDSEVEGNGMFLGKRDYTYLIRHMGEGLIIKPAEHSNIRGFYVKHNGDIYQGKGILHNLLGSIPLLNILF